MAITRKMLAAMGIETDKIEEIIEAHVETVNGLKEEIDKHKTATENLESVRKELDEAKKTVEKSEKFEAQYNDMKAKHDSLQEKYDKMKSDFDSFKEDQAAKDTKAKKTKAYQELLKETGIADKHMGLVLEVLDGRKKIDEITITEDGKVEGADAIREALKKDFDIYISNESSRGASTATPPDNNGGAATGRARELAAKYHENLYGKED